MKDNTCCFFGHRRIEDNDSLRARLYETIERLIVDENIDTFLFGSKSEFDSLCHEIVSKIKNKYTNIKRVWVRAEYPFIDEAYKAYVLENYEDTYYPEHIINAGRAVYVERNCEMIDKSSVCVVYYSLGCQLKSGTKIAYDYAKKNNKRIINLKI